MKRYKINNMDVMDWAKKYKGPKFHALLTDAPYHLTTITKRFGKNGSAPAQFGKDGAFQRVGKGFMGQEWDGNMISFNPEMWAALGEHLYPGAFGMTFGGSRTAHRIAVAIEDAGFIIHPMVFWLYGSGFPKATRVKGHKEFDGHRYGMQALKPAAEPIIVFQKPYDDKPVQNIVATGAGALNIDAGRIALAENDEYVINTFDDGAKPFGGGAGHKYSSRKVSLSGGAYSKNGKRSALAGDGRVGASAGMFQAGKTVGKEFVEPSGRWPANFILDNSVSNVLDAQSGHLKSGKFTADTVINSDWGYTGGKRSPLPLSNTIGDEGGASRFFYNVQTQLDEADPFKYQKKASAKERNAGLQSEPKKKVSFMNTHNGDASKGEEWHPIDYKTGKPRDRFKAEHNNDHPTVKPIDLNRYLASLLLPPVDYAPRRILVPFSGVMSEGIGALLAGWEYVEAIELGKHYCELGEKRVKYWLGANYEKTKP